MKNHVWLVGAGTMALDYAKVLAAQQVSFTVIGRGEKSAKEFEQKTGNLVIRGGLSHVLTRNLEIPERVIVSVGVEELKNVSIQLIESGVKQLLVEKPGGFNSYEINELKDTAERTRAEVYIAYNRRFYSSTIKAREIIQQDGGATSFNFEFTEWPHIIVDLPVSAEIKQNWFLANSTHVVDLAFHLCGKPREISCYTAGALDWHPSASIFAGAGVTTHGVLFSYQANWDAPGRWGVEILTKKHRLIFRPIEKLQMQKMKSVAVEFVEIDDTLDRNFKPGLYIQVKSFLEGKTNELCTIEKQLQNVNIYDRIAGYKS